MSGMVWTPGVVTVLLGVAAGATDLLRRSIPNWLCMGGVLCGLCAQSLFGGWRGLISALAGAAIGLAVFLPLCWKGAMGGGDVKLMAAFGSLLGPVGVLTAALFASIVGGALAAAWIIFKPRTKAIPFAPALVLGAWLSLLARS